MTIKLIPDRVNEYDKNYSEITIHVPGNDLTIDDVFENLIRPLLLGAGFHPNSIAKWIGE